MPRSALLLSLVLLGCATPRAGENSAAGPLTGFVRDGRSGEPVGAARVLVLGSDRWSDTDGRGVYLLRGLTMGEHTLVAVAPECRVAAGTVALGWTSQRVDLELERWSPEAFAARFFAAPDLAAEGASGRVITQQELQASSASNLAELLQRVAPDMISLPSGQVGGATRTRGRVGSMRPGAPRPLVILDGVVMGGGPERPRGLGGSVDILSDLRPRDVQRIEILRGPAAGALYGSSGAAGAIRIYTGRAPEGLDARVPVRFCRGAERG